jgi:multidrug efflux pump subunit AcrB
MLVAITLIPTASARMTFGSEGQGADQPHRLQQAVLRTVARFIDTPRRRLVTIVSSVVASVAVIVFLTPAAEYLPEGEEAKAFIFVSSPPGYSLETMVDILQQAQDRFLPHIGADPKAWERGETDVPAIKYFNISANPGGLFLVSESVDPSHIDALMDVYTEAFRGFPGMRAFASRGSIISSNDGGTRSINLDISGPDLGVIYTAAQVTYDRANEVFGNPRIQSSPSSLSLDQPLVEIRPDWDRAAELGMSAEDIGFAVAALTDGAFVDEFYLADDKIDIYLFSDQPSEGRLDRLAELPIYTPAGTVLPLGAIASIRETVDTSEVRRVNGRRNVTLNIIPPPDIPLETGVEIVKREVIEALRASGDLPRSVNVEISGASDQLDATQAALTANYPVALIIVFLLLVAIFRHWGYPLLIMTTIPVGIAGGIVGLVLMNMVGSIAEAMGFGHVRQPFDMISMLGFLILMGTVVNNPILIVDRALRNVREEGMEALAAVKEAVAVRLRPITMSTLTTLVGLSPLVFIPGAGTELYRGVGVIVLFGILGATLVSLTMLPALTVSFLKIWGQKK